MEPTIRTRSSLLRRGINLILDSFRERLATLKPGGRDFMSQRMCPFCGLITSRYKTCCLECGKLLTPA